MRNWILAALFSGINMGCNDTETTYYVDRDADGWCTEEYGKEDSSGFDKYTFQQDCYTRADWDAYAYDPVREDVGLWYYDLGQAEDCNDTNPTVYPGTYGYNSYNHDRNVYDPSTAAIEVCDGIDNNCDGGVDKDPVDGTIYYVDYDGDGFGRVEHMLCELETGYSVIAGDCDDRDPTVNPVADGCDADCDGNPNTDTEGIEVCNGLDDDCDGEIDEDDAIDASTWYADEDDDDYGKSYGNDTVVACNAPPGYMSDNSDCNDSESAINPGAREVCNGLDDDCDGQVDEGLEEDFFLDADGDGYGSDAEQINTECLCPENYVTNNSDCNDSESAINPGATEICGNGINEDCAGEDLPC